MRIRFLPARTAGNGFRCDEDGRAVHGEDGERLGLRLLLREGICSPFGGEESGGVLPRKITPPAQAQGLKKNER